MPSKAPRGRAKTLMIQGTASHVGKSFLVAALCRIFRDMGYRVAPFKAQNVSLNSYVSKEGLEVARAQAFQALAAGTEPEVDMNPILIKPESHGRAQLVVKGRPYSKLANWQASQLAPFLLKVVKESLEGLMKRYELVLMEGAGSPAEPNLYDIDVANMKVAEMVRAPVLLVGDIERGGVFASFLGTWELLREEHRALVKGFIINKFRGDPCILEPALEALRLRTGIPTLGILPYLEGLSLPAEDCEGLYEHHPLGRELGLDLAVLALPHISNFTDLDALMMEGVRIRYVKSSGGLGRPDALVIPGTKNTVQDLLWLKDEGFKDAIMELREEGIPILGICGGYQLLGLWLLDPWGFEGGERGGRYEGLGLLSAKTLFNRWDKTTRRVEAKIVGEGPLLEEARGAIIQGYEVHMGITISKERPWLEVRELGGSRSSFEGSLSPDGLVLGTYLHGLFDDPPFRHSFLLHLIRKKGLKLKAELHEASLHQLWEERITLASRRVKEHLKIDAIMNLLE